MVSIPPSIKGTRFLVQPQVRAVRTGYKELTCKLLALGLLSVFCTNIFGTDPQVPPEFQSKQVPQKPKPTPRATPNQSESDEATLRKQEAVTLLMGAIEKARRLDDGIIKVKILTQGGDAIWDKDEALGRKLLVDTLAIVDSLLNVDKIRSLEAKASAQNTARLEALRSDLFQRIARHDFALAEKLRNAIKVDEGNQGGRANAPDPREDLAWDTAIAVAGTHPEQTIRFVESSLQKGIDPTLGEALIEVRQQNVELADRLFGEAIAVARANFGIFDAVEILAEYVLPTEEEQVQGQLFLESRAEITRNFLAYVADKLEAQAAFGVDVTSRELPHEYRMLQMLLPFFERLTPNRAVVVRDRINAISSALSHQTTPASREEQLDDLIHQAEKILDDRKRDIAFIKASQAALNLGDLQRAVSIAEKISDPEDQMIQVSLLTYQAGRLKIQRGETDEAIQLAEKIQFLPQRVALFIQIATNLHAKKQDDLARALLEQTWNWTNKADNTPQKARALLTLTSTMADYDSERSFAFIQSAVSTIDRVDFSTKETSRKPSRIAPVTLDMLDLSQTFSKLARVSFDRAIQVAESFRTKEASLLAEVTVCRQVLTSNVGLSAQKSKIK